MNVLVVEDERTDFILIQHAIEQLGDNYLVVHARGCHEAVQAIEQSPVSLAVVDILLPDGDGYKIAEHLKTRRIPYVMVSSKALPKNVVQGLRSGAEDYVRKPFDVEELTARLERVLMRASADAPTAAAMTFEEEGGAIQVGELRVPLTPIEERLLQLLRERYDTYVSSEELIDSVWGHTHQGNVKGALRTYISHIRKKLARARVPLTIISKWGRGYRLTEPAEFEA